jgi:hypothetical protein
LKPLIGVIDPHLRLWYFSAHSKSPFFFYFRNALCQLKLETSGKSLAWFWVDSTFGLGVPWIHATSCDFELHVVFLKPAIFRKESFEFRVSSFK